MKMTAQSRWRSIKETVLNTKVQLCIAGIGTILCFAGGIDSAVQHENWSAMSVSFLCSFLSSFLFWLHWHCLTDGFFEWKPTTFSRMTKIGIVICILSLLAMVVCLTIAGVNEQAFAQPKENLWMTSFQLLICAKWASMIAVFARKYGNTTYRYRLSIQTKTSNLEILVLPPLHFTMTVHNSKMYTYDGDTFYVDKANEVNLRGMCHNVKVQLWIAGLGIFAGVSAGIDFAFAYQNWSAVTMCFISAFFASWLFYLHWQYKKNAIFEWKPSTFQYMMWFNAVICVLATAGMTTCLIIGGVQKQTLSTEGLKGENMWITSVWFFMTAKWSMLMATFSRKYGNQLTAPLVKTTPIYPPGREEEQVY